MYGTLESRAPAPVWADAPRWRPHIQLPAQCYLPGLTARPAPDTAAIHSAQVNPVVLGAALWRQNDMYLFGIDLYHQGYFWESHEAWERVWRALPKPDVRAWLLQGLIRNSAAQVKACAGSIRGVQSHSRHGYELFCAVRDSGGSDAEGRFMGLSAPDVLSQMERHYAPIWAGAYAATPALNGPPPRFELR